MGLKQKINEDMKAAMRAKATERLAAIRMAMAAIKQKEVDERQELTDGDVVGVLEKMIKQRRESISQYQKAARQDLVDAEQLELDVLQAYMPQPLSDAEVDDAIAQAIADTGARSPRDMGKVMGVLKNRLAGRADMSAVSGKVKGQLVG